MAHSLVTRVLRGCSHSLFVLQCVNLHITALKGSSMKETNDCQIKVSLLGFYISTQINISFSPTRKKQTIAYLKLILLNTHFPFVTLKKKIIVQSKLTQKHRHFLRYQKIFLQNAVCSIPGCCFTHPTLTSLVTQCGLICVYPIDHIYINCWFQVYRWSVMENSTPPNTWK